MAIRQLRRPAAPLRFRLERYFKPINFLGLFLALILFQGFFEYFFKFTIGISFLGLYARSFKLGMYVLVGLTALYFLLRSKPDRNQVRPGALLLALILLEIVLGMGLSVYLGLDQKNARLPLYFDSLLSVLLIIPFAYAAVEKVEDLYRVMRWFVTGLVVLAGFEVFARVVGPSLVLVRSFALTSYRLTLPIAVLFFLVAGLTSHRPRISHLLYSAIAALGVVIAFNKPIFVPFIVSLVFAILLLLVLPKNRIAFRKRDVLLSLLVMVVLLVLFILLVEIVVPGDYLGGYVAVFERYVLKVNPSTNESIGRVDGGRFYLYARAWEMFLANPIFGRGLGVTIISDGGTQIPPHSIIFDLMAGTGLAGTLPFIAGIVILFLYVLRNADFTRMIELKVAMLGYVVFGFAFALVGVLWEYAYIYFPMAIYIGCLLKVATLDGNRRRPVQ